MTVILVSYYTELNVSTSVESIIFVLKKITALKKSCANLPHSPLLYLPNKTCVVYVL